MSRGTREPEPGRPSRFRLQGFHLLWLPFPEGFGYPEGFITSPRLPWRRAFRSHYPALATPTGFNTRVGLGCSPFAHHYSGNRFCFLFLRLLRCFTSPGIASLVKPEMTHLSVSRVAPFGYPGISGCLHLPRAYRSLPRPSSPPGAEASTTCP